MGKYLPLKVQPYAMALRQAQLAGQVSAAHLPRFVKEFRLSDQGIQLTAEFSSLIDDSLVSVKMTLKGGVVLRCERCLSDFDYQLNHQQHLLVTRQKSDAENAAGNSDFIVCMNDDMEMAELVEDELFLALPQIPMHESLDECDSMVKEYFLNKETGAVARSNPFSVLKKL